MLAALCFGVVVGAALPNRGPVVGSFTINKTDPSDDIFKLTFDTDLPEFENADYIVFRVKKTEYPEYRDAY